jgi:hypothetical protein
MRNARGHWAGLVVLAAALAGCQPPPPVIIADLPTHSLLTPPRGLGDAGDSSGSASAGDVPAQWHSDALARPWKWIVVHHSATAAGSADVFDRAHRARGWEELGYHFVIDNGNGGPDGRVEVGGRWTKQKWGAHCKTPDNAYNDYGIGICLVGDFTTGLPTPAQMKSLRALLAYLMTEYKIDPASVIGHRDAPGAQTACPGDEFWAYLHNTLKPELAKPAK